MTFLVHGATFYGRRARNKRTRALTSVAPQSRSQVQYCRSVNGAMYAISFPLHPLHVLVPRHKTLTFGIAFSNDSNRCEMTFWTLPSLSLFIFDPGTRGVQESYLPTAQNFIVVTLRSQVFK